MAKKLTLRKTIEINDAIAAVEKAVTFDIKVSWDLSALKDKAERQVKRFFKEKDKWFLARETKADTSKLEPLKDYLLVGINNTYNVPVLTDDFEEVNDKIEKMKDTIFIDFKDLSFKLEDFERESSEVVDGKSVKKKNPLVTPAFLKALAPFIAGYEADTDEDIQFAEDEEVVVGSGVNDLE